MLQKFADRAKPFGVLAQKRLRLVHDRDIFLLLVTYQDIYAVNLEWGCLMLATN